MFVYVCVVVTTALEACSKQKCVKFARAVDAGQSGQCQAQCGVYV